VTGRSGRATPLRLLAAAVLTAVPLGQTWSAGYFSTGYTIYGDCDYTDNTYCTQDLYVPGYFRPGSLGRDVPIGLFLALAAAIFVIVALRRRTERTRRAARAGTAALGIATALALGGGAANAVICGLAALALTVPPVWGRPVLAQSPPPG
jgi:hypothetical protein